MHGWSRLRRTSRHDPPASPAGPAPAAFPVDTTAPAPASIVRRLLLRSLIGFAGLSVALVVTQLALHLRNVPFWDEVDGVLSNLLRLDLSQPLPDSFANLFALQNEHRLFTSNLLFATVFRLTGGLNFTALAVLGNVYLLLCCAVLIERAGDWSRRARLAAVLGLVVVHLQHHENLFWSGSSIDHFHVVLLAVLALALVTDGTRRGLLGGILFALLASYTLAHGFVVWAVGALWLAAGTRRRALALWLGCAVFALACYLPGFVVNPGHHIEASAHVSRVAVYWLGLLGATPAIGHLAVAPWCGAALLGGVVMLASRGRWRSEPLVFGVIAFCLGSLALIAVGRTGVSAGILLPSRYAILSAVAWALVAWLCLERELARPRLRRPLLAALGVALVTMNLALNVRYFGEGARFARQREEAAGWFRYHRTFAGSPFVLYPRAALADQIFNQVAARGIYSLPTAARRVTIEGANPTASMAYVLDELKTDAENVYIRGWAFLPDHAPAAGELHVIFESPTRFEVYAAASVSRPDVAQAFHNPQLVHAGFQLVLPRDALPKETPLAIGVLLKRTGALPEFALSQRRLQLSSLSWASNRLLTAQ